MLNEFEIIDPINDATPFVLNKIIEKYKKKIAEVGIDADWVFGKSRKQRHIKYRYVFIYFLKIEYQFGLSTIAYTMHKNHSTIIYSIEQAEKLIKYFKDPVAIKFYEYLEGIK
jgi:chromosomal replication initiation ATPase DnaA